MSCAERVRDAISISSPTTQINVSPGSKAGNRAEAAGRHNVTNECTRSVEEEDTQRPLPKLSIPCYDPAVGCMKPRAERSMYHPHHVGVTERGPKGEEAGKP